jgi:LPXTG-site transpeptidase (sortase) family protein
MPRKLFVFLIATTALLGICGIGMLLMSLAGWLFFPSTEQSRLVRIVPIAPLSTSAATVPQSDAASPPGLVEAAVKQSLATVTPTPVTISPTAVPGPTATATPIVLQKGVATRLVIPKISLDAPVLLAPIENRTWKVDHLGQTVGHLEATASPGSNSNIVLAGHVTLATGGYGPFANLVQLVPGDMVIVYEGDQEFFYVIEDAHRVTRDDVGVTYPTNTGQITLLTCIDWNGDEGRYLNRLIVKGRLIKS